MPEASVTSMASMMTGSTVTTSPKVYHKDYKTLAPTSAMYAAPEPSAPVEVGILQFLCTARLITVRPRMASKASCCKLRHGACAQGTGA